jgi:hypothetical protein
VDEEADTGRRHLRSLTRSDGRIGGIGLNSTR